MNCPKCGAEVADQAVYCQKCGERVDLVDEESPETDPGDAGRVAEQMPPEGASEGAAGHAPSPAERFRQSTAARQGAGDEPEEEIWHGGYSSKAMLGAWLLTTSITIVLLVLAFYVSRGWFWKTVGVVVPLLWLYQLLKLCFRRMNVRYKLTTQRFIHETGILRRVTDRIEVIDMDDITFTQSFLERFVGVGTVHVSSSDRTHPELFLRGIEDVKVVAEKVDNIRRSERRRRGLHIESI